MERGTPKIRSDAQIQMGVRLARNWAKIRSWLEQQHGELTVRQVATIVGIPKTSIGNLESGRFGTSVDTLVPIAEALGFEVWQLLVSDFDPHRPPRIVIDEEPKVARRQKVRA